MAVTTSLEATESRVESVKPPSPAVSRDRNNNFNLIRLALAVMVILSHSWEQIDGDRHREIMTRIFHNLSLGEFAVDGFFLISGFLIVQSWESNPVLVAYLTKRVLRIYPGFMAASLICALIVAPLGAIPSHYFANFHPMHYVIGLLALRRPYIPPVFQGTHFPEVDGPTWSIPYEFRCYLFVALLGVLGFFKRKELWVAIVVVAMLFDMNPSVTSHLKFHGSNTLFGEPDAVARLLALFASGACFYFYRARIRYTSVGAGIAAVILVLCLFKPLPSKIAILAALPYLLFWLAYLKLPILARFQKLPDISYGVYLYGWPIEKLLIWLTPIRTPIIIFFLTLALSCLCGLASWRLIEHPFLRLRSNNMNRRLA